MQKILIILVCSLPLTSIGRYVLGKYVSVTMMIEAVIVFYFLAGFAVNCQYIIKKKEAVWLFLCGVFIFFSLISLLISPYREEAFSKGVIQVLGICIMILSSLSLIKEITNNPLLLLRLTRILSISLGIVAGIGILQFIFNNLVGKLNYINFSFLNDLSNGLVWKFGGLLGNFYRSNSLCREPSHFALTLGAGAGLSVFRLGFLGSDYKRSLCGIVPMWAALFIFLGILSSISIIGYAQLIFTIVFVLFLSRRGVKADFVKMNIFIFTVIFIFYFIYLYAGDHFYEKLLSIRLIFTVPFNGIERINSQDVTAVAIATNIGVMIDNLKHNMLLGVGVGAHPFSYLYLAKNFQILGNNLWGINSQTAGGLFIRLLSETGLIGTTSFLIVFLYALVKSSLAIKRQVRFEMKLNQIPTLGPYRVIGISFSASCASVFLICLGRWGVYYDPELWFLLAVTLCVPQYILFDQLKFAKF